MQFDCDGNLFVYEPGALCSGIPRKIPQGFTQDELNFVDTTTRNSQWNRFQTIPKQDIHKIVAGSPFKPIVMRKATR